MPRRVHIYAATYTEVEAFRAKAPSQRYSALRARLFIHVEELAMLAPLRFPSLRRRAEGMRFTKSLS